MLPLFLNSREEKRSVIGKGFAIALRFLCLKYL